MSHTFGVLCQYGTEHLPSGGCPERGCETNHGWTTVECPTPEECEQFARQCPTCHPQVEVPEPDLTPITHRHPPPISAPDPQPSDG